MSGAVLCHVWSLKPFINFQWAALFICTGSDIFIMSSAISLLWNIDGYWWT
jgi:hypothetical protein